MISAVAQPVRHVMVNHFKISDRRYRNGFTYVGLLIAVVFFGLGSVGAARILASSERGERERELLFVGNEFRKAIGSYYRSIPSAPRYPERLEDLVLDSRFPAVRRHLRKIYPDPVTGRPEWGLVVAPEGGIMGVFSQSEREPMKRTNFDFEDRGFEGAAKFTSGRPYSYRDWQFIYQPLARSSLPAATILK
jgi:type II secretory pathway pseudopilin PulG